MISREVGPALSAELRAVLDEMDSIRNRFRTEELDEREWLERSLARCETAVRRVLHLIGA